MHEDVTLEELGGAKVHCQVTGVADFRVKSEKECMEAIKKLLSFIPQNCDAQPERGIPVTTRRGPRRSLAEIVPAHPTHGYDMHKVIKEIVDQRRFL